MKYTSWSALALVMVFNSPLSLADEQISMLTSFPAHIAANPLSKTSPDVKTALIKEEDVLEINPIANLLSIPGAFYAQPGKKTDVVFYCNGHNCLYTTAELIRR
ncbi:MAG: hypothetical protein M3A44_06130 [Gammaproteobacteria bacterium]